MGRRYAHAAGGRTDGAPHSLLINEAGVRCGEGTWSLTFTITLLHYVADDHVRDNGRCVLAKWSCVDADRWTKGIPRSSKSTSVAEYVR